MSHSFDLRGLSIEQKRFRTRAKKYYGFRAVKPGQLVRPHYNFRTTRAGPIWYDAPISTETPTEIWTKQRLYIEAQQWPRPPTYHHAHRDKGDKRGAKMVYERRRWERRERARVLQCALMPGRTWKEHNEGASMGGVSDTELGQEGERDEQYESEAEVGSRNIQETVAEREEQAVYQLAADAAMAQRIKAPCQLESDGWSLCDTEDALSDWSSDFELV